MDVETYRSLVLLVAAAMSIRVAIWAAWTGRRREGRDKAIYLAVVDRGIARRGR